MLNAVDCSTVLSMDSGKGHFNKGVTGLARIKLALYMHVNTVHLPLQRPHQPLLLHMIKSPFLASHSAPKHTINSEHITIRIVHMYS